MHLCVLRAEAIHEVTMFQLQMFNAALMINLFVMTPTQEFEAIVSYFNY